MASKVNSREGMIMTKKEKIVAIFFCFSMFLLIFLSIYTIVSNKPQGYEFRIEKLIKKIVKY